MKKTRLWIIPLVVAVIALIVGASFHGCRMNPNNQELYNLGVNMGISMASLAGASFLVMVIFLIIFNRKKK